MLLNNFILNNLKLGQMVSLELLEVVVSCNDNLFAIVTDSEWICCQCDILYSVWTYALEAFKEILSHRETRH